MKCRSRATRSVIALFAIGVVACVHGPSRLRQERRVSYWEALADLIPADAIASARTPSEKEFAEALENLMSGNLEKAEQRFGVLRNTATDSIIRTGSRVIYTATLQYQEKWGTLAELKNEPSQPKADRTDRASIELWAQAFKNIPSKSFTFRSSSVRLPMSMSAVGTPLIPVRIGGRTYNFWLDTGSSLTMLASDVASDLNITPLVPDTLEIVTSTGRVKANPTLIPQLEIGQLTVRNAPAMIVEESMMRMSEPRPIEQSQHVKIDGIIGFDIIRQIDVEVDFGDNNLRLRDTSASRPEADRNMYVTETLLDKLQLSAARIESRRVGGLGGEISLRAPVLPDLRVLVRGFPILFRGAVVRAPVYQVLASLDGVLGGDIWNSGVVRIDMTNGVFAVRKPRSN